MHLVSAKWGTTALYAVSISLCVLLCYYYWFGVANRHVVFLYGHLGATAFDQVTRSRYWMAGLVASGFVLLLYLAANWSLSHLSKPKQRNYYLPPWWIVWLVSTPILALGIPLITMALNQPRMTLTIAAQSTLAAVSGIALALIAGSLATRQLTELAWFALYGFGLTPALILIRAVELPGRGLANASEAYLSAIAGVTVSVVWVGVLTYCRFLRRKTLLKPHQILAAGLSIAYLLLPFAHYVFFVPPTYRYISSASNFFASRSIVQLFSLGLVVSITIGAGLFQLVLERSQSLKSR